MNRAERRRRARAGGGGQGSGEGELRWRTVLDTKPMSEGMPPYFLLALLNENQGFAHHSKLLMATIWLQSQMVGLICLHENPDLRANYAVDNGRHFPQNLLRAAARKLETLASGSLQQKFLEHFGSEMSVELKSDLERVIINRDALAHGYVSMMRYVMDPTGLTWSPRASRGRDEALERVAGRPRPSPDTYFRISLEELDYNDEIARLCRVMDFAASKVNGWGIAYPVFA